MENAIKLDSQLLQRPMKWIVVHPKLEQIFTVSKIQTPSSCQSYHYLLKQLNAF